MIKKTITFEGYNGEQVTEDYYFNFTKLELAEKDMEYGGLEKLGRELGESSDPKRAYTIFKKLLLDSYGIKSDDGRRFVKSDEIRADLESSPALSELILELMTNVEDAVNFFKQLLPAGMLAEVEKADMLGSAPTATDAPVAPEKTEPTDEELLKMSPQDMTPDQLRRAYTLKTKVGD